MPDPLQSEAREFAQELAHMLNTTITDGITLSVVQTYADSVRQFTIGHGLSKDNPFKPSLIPLTVTKRKALLYLYALHVVRLDADGKSLMDWKSNYAVQVGESADNGTLFAYDYARGQANQYPRAHFHISADMTSQYAEALKNTERTEIRDLHFPVGGYPEPESSVRYRPILEDIVEMLILEKMVGHKADWEAAVREGRERFYTAQRKSAQIQRGC